MQAIFKTWNREKSAINQEILEAKVDQVEVKYQEPQTLSLGRGL